MATLVAVPFAAGAQHEGVPGGGLGVPPAGPAPACQQLMALRDETQKHGLAIQKANERKASVQEACKLFKTYLAAEAKFMKGIEEHGRACGAPSEVIKQIGESHTKASRIGKEVCEAAARGSGLGGPSLYNAPRGDLAAGARFGGMPDLPGGPPVERSPACQHLLTLHDEIQKHGQAIQKASQRRASAQETCPLFRKFLAAETSFIRRIEESGRTCGVPSDYLKQIREGHAKALEIGKDSCEAAAQKPWLEDVLQPHLRPTTN
jgi:hypothetical protein